MSRDKLMELAERCEKATGPSFALFAEAFEAIHGGRSSLGEKWSAFCSLVDAEAWLDAAMTLYIRVPERVPGNPRLATAEALRQRAEEA